MATYSIKQLEALSGIKAHTLRIWEKRYRLLNRQDLMVIKEYMEMKSLKSY
jgi:MerR family transcriptional regulator, light-induced transcriptional regulator